MEKENSSEEKQRGPLSMGQERLVSHVSDKGYQSLMKFGPWDGNDGCSSQQREQPRKHWIPVCKAFGFLGKPTSFH